MKTSFYKEIGGVNCEYEHMNFSTHDLLYRMQQNGSKFFLSTNFVLNCDWNPNSEEYQPVLSVIASDYAIFKRDWGQPNDRFKIDLDNWKNADKRWTRRFGDA